MKTNRKEVDEALTILRDARNTDRQNKALKYLKVQWLVLTPEEKAEVLGYGSWIPPQTWFTLPMPLDGRVDTKNTLAARYRRQEIKVKYLSWLRQKERQLSTYKVSFIEYIVVGVGVICAISAVASMLVHLIRRFL